MPSTPSPSTRGAQRTRKHSAVVSPTTRSRRKSQPPPPSPKDPPVIEKGPTPPPKDPPPVPHKPHRDKTHSNMPDHDKSTDAVITSHRVPNKTRRTRARSHVATPRTLPPEIPPSVPRSSARAPLQKTDNKKARRQPSHDALTPYTRPSSWHEPRQRIKNRVKDLEAASRAEKWEMVRRVLAEGSEFTPLDGQQEDQEREGAQRKRRKMIYVRNREFWI
jgi:hypothetical protein